MNLEVDATQFEQFRKQVYQNFTKRDDSAMELLDALCSTPNARSVVELSLSPHFKHQYPSVYKAIANAGWEDVDLGKLIGQYLTQLRSLAAELEAPLITGSTPNPERERIYEEFRQGRTRVIVVSKVANFAIDLPEASVAIQVSGTFGSRQEEAQRHGRIRRPHTRNAYFYTLVSNLVMV